MNNNIIRNVKKYKHPIVISLIITALSLYALPVEKLFTELAEAQRGGGNRDGPYGNVRQGPPAFTPGGGPPAETPGGGPPEERGPPAPRDGPPR